MEAEEYLHDAGRRAPREDIEVAEGGRELGLGAELVEGAPPVAGGAAAVDDRLIGPTRFRSQRVFFRKIQTPQKPVKNTKNAGFIGVSRVIARS